MAEKTIPSLPTISALDVNSLFLVDSGTETFKVNGADLALFIRESILPAGITAPFAGSVAPLGWLLCDGSAVSRTTYAKLFAAIGTAYGVGDGTTTFNLPDVRGRVVAGKDNMGGSAAGRLTAGVAGFDGTTVGAAGGSQTYTPAGTIGGSQSIAHTHNIAHAHQIMNHDSGSPSKTYMLDTLDDSKTNIPASGLEAWDEFGNYTQTGSGFAMKWGVGTHDFYTTGVLSPPTGSDGSTAASSAMSTNTIVNGSNFSFTGTASHRVQPTIVMNTIIKT